MDVVALIIAIVGGATGLSGLVVSIRADRRAERADKRAAGAEQRAERAEEAGARARQRELWTELIGAMQGIVGVSVLHQDMRPLLVRVRTARTELVDGVSSDHYKRLGDWMAVDHVVLATLFEQTMSKLPGNSHTLQQIEEDHRPALDWAAASIINLRLMRRLEPGAEVERNIEELITAGKETFSKFDSRDPLLQDGR